MHCLGAKRESMFVYHTSTATGQPINRATTPILPTCILIMVCICVEHRMHAIIYNQIHTLLNAFVDLSIHNAISNKSAGATK